MANIATQGLFRYLEESKSVDRISGKIYVHRTRQIQIEEFRPPIKVDCTICCICLGGELWGKIDMKPYRVRPSSMTISLPGQIVEFEKQSEDFCGIFIYLTNQFTDELNIFLDHAVGLRIINQPHIELRKKELKSILNYYNVIKRVIKTKDNPNRLQIISYLTLAYFYGIGYFLHKAGRNEAKSQNRIIADTFIKNVRRNFKAERKVHFYAREMNLSANYLSHVIKEVTGKTASKWIDDYVILEAKALLKSTDMNIQQIAMELNFPTQTFFGKYFKRITRVAPKFYR